VVSEEPNLQSGTITDGKKKTKKKTKDDVFIPTNIVWKWGTLMGKANREAQEDWLKRSGRNPENARYAQLKVRELAVVVHKCMLEDAENRRLAKLALIEEGKQLEKAQAEESRPPSHQASDDAEARRKKAIRDGKRKVVEVESDADSPALRKARKKTKAAPSSRADEEQSAIGSDEEQLGSITESEYEPEPDDQPNDQPENEADDDADVDVEMEEVSAWVEGEASKQDKEKATWEAKTAKIRNDLKAVRSAALDSLLLIKNCKDQAASSSTGQGTATGTVLRRYAEYEDRSPQLILQGPNGKPIFDYETQCKVGEIMRLHASIARKVRAGAHKDRYTPQLRTLQTYCRRVRTKVGKPFQEMNPQPVDHKDRANDIVNDLFIMDLNIPGAEI
jgi:hypothetical protein